MKAVRGKTFVLALKYAPTFEWLYSFAYFLVFIIFRFSFWQFNENKNIDARILVIHSPIKNLELL